MSANLKALAVSVSAGSLTLIAGAATAQNLSLGDAAVDNFSRNRNTAVQQRVRPEFEAPGLRAGAFLVYPRLELSAETNSNIYASETNKVDDVITHLRPEISVESDWSQNYLSAYVRGSINRYADYGSEDVDEFGVGARGRIDVSRSSGIDVGVDYLDGFEPRTSPSAPRNAVEPTDLQTLHAYISGSRSAGYLKLSGRAGFGSYDYADGRTGLGAVIDQDARDRDVRSLTGRADVALSPDTAFFLQVTGNERQYDIASTALVPNRDSSGIEYLLGINFEVSALVRGEIAVGYIEQDFDSPTFQDVDGFGGRAQLEWFPSEITTVTVAAGRTVEDTPTTGVGGYLSNAASLAVDHELMRNIILNARVTWGRDEYQGIDREDARLGFSLGGTYLINRRLGVNANFSSVDTESTGLRREQDFKVNKLAVALVAQF